MVSPSIVISRSTARSGSERIDALSSLPLAMKSRVRPGFVRIVTSSFVDAVSAEPRTMRFLISPAFGSTAITACGCARLLQIVPSLPRAPPRGSPETDQRRITFLSREGTEERTSAALANKLAAVVSSTRAVSLVLESVGEFFDDRVSEKPLTHLSNLRFDLLPCLPTVRKHDPKQLAGPNIFHAREAKRAERMLDGFALRVEDGGFQFDGDGCFHCLRILRVARLPSHPVARQGCCAG